MKTLTTAALVVTLMPLTASAQLRPGNPAPLPASSNQELPQTGNVQLAPIVKPPVALPSPVTLPDVVPPDVASPYSGTGMLFPTSPCTACQFAPTGRCRRCGKSHTGRWETQTKPNLQKSHWGYCDLFCERPFGSLVDMHMGAMVNNGIQEQMALYAYDFESPLSKNASALSGRGRYELRKLAILMQQGFGPLLIETANPKLDAARRQNVIEQLGQLGVAVGPDQVLFRGRPRHQFTGQEALPIQQRNLELMGSGVGAAATTSTGSGR